MKKNPSVEVIYDGECPFCSNFVSLSRLQDLGYKVTLINARDNANPIVGELSKSYNLDNGMIVIVGDEILYGASAASFIATGFVKQDLISRIYRGLLKRDNISKLIYPVLVIMRKIYFKVIGKKLINNDS